MTVFGRDASNFDGSINYAGLGFLTHKATEGISVVHDRYGPRLTAARDAGVPVLGAYHVLRSPSTADGSHAQQLAYWLRYLDAHTPWWRTHPHFMLQIDAERWPYDNVTPAEVLAFAQVVVGSGEPGFKITYASRGQYGDQLRGIVTPLWNANYSGGPSYPGDGWAPGWAPYSGQTPVFLQYTSTGYDHNAYRGTLGQLLTLVGGTTKGTTMATDTTRAEVLGGDLSAGDNVLHTRLRLAEDADDALAAQQPFAKDIPKVPGRKQLGEKLDALAKKVDGIAVGGVDLDVLATKVADELAKRLGNG